jgi:predicted RNA-binding Zn ribbon-like protein
VAIVLAAALRLPRRRPSSHADLVAWSLHAGSLSEPEAANLSRLAAEHPAQAQEVLAQALTLREGQYRIFSAVIQIRSPDAADLTNLNQVWAAALAHSRLAWTPEGFSVEWHAGPRARALEQPLWAVARSAVELLTSPELGRVRTCPGDGCGWLFVDLSRNLSRR